ncbi:MBL fold metallo-hydrolase [Rhizosphaericola mali]|uniref:MBL fold metallo-hydrolase n=1 Tax=Rhizosphaericola mali TaxID=2545455 RepID=A0A5P2G7T2_9BACT|nr:MBL fold metallo-hydrolase [Rhizosphaericola mali]QES89263.1 MBL fold metallo-hydrolase [Rhizosphaericola mali]
MKKLSFLFSNLCICILLSNSLFAQSASLDFNKIHITAIQHASFEMQYKGKTILVDPSFDNKSPDSIVAPDYIIYTDIHEDHYNAKLLPKLPIKKSTIIIAPEAVAKLIPTNYHVEILKNGDSKKENFFTIKAIPMYNLTPERLKFHNKGRGNGYVITINNKNIYISGDTEDIPEMRQLKNIDLAFLCMNLPYTMTVEQAASAVHDFQPKIVIPFHYRGGNGFSDINEFKSLVEKDTPKTRVEFLKWY